MFKAFQKGQQFKGFPALNFQMNNEAYGFSGCTLWLNALYGLNTTTNLAAISEWRDLIGGLSFTQSTLANQPRLQLTDAAFNNNPVVDFNTTARGLFSTNSIAVKSGTLVMVYQYISSATSTSYTSRLISNGDQTNVRAAGISFSWNRNNNSAILNETGFYSGGITANATSVDEYDTGVKISIVNPNFWYSNGVPVTLTNGSLSAIQGMAFNTIGGSGATFSGVFKVAEILYYNRAMTSDEILTLSSLLNIKYALY
jgi:hypothetical protein